MLGKLIKYEFRATRRTMLPLYAALLCVALLTRLSMSALSVPGGGAHHGFLNFVAGIMGMLFGLLTFALGFITLFLMAQRFQKISWETRATSPLPCPSLSARTLRQS